MDSNLEPNFAFRSREFLNLNLNLAFSSVQFRFEPEIAPATSLAASPRASTASNVPVIAVSAKVVSGDLAAVTLEKQHQTLRRLRTWAPDCRRVNAITWYMGWVTERSR